MKTFLSDIEQLVINNKHKEALEILYDRCDKLNLSSLKNEVVILQARSANIKKQHRLQSSDIKYDLNNLLNAILELSVAIFENSESGPTNEDRRLITESKLKILNSHIKNIILRRKKDIKRLIMFSGFLLITGLMVFIYSQFLSSFNPNVRDIINLFSLFIEALILIPGKIIMSKYSTIDLFKEFQERIQGILKTPTLSTEEFTEDYNNIRSLVHESWKMTAKSSFP